MALTSTLSKIAEDFIIQHDLKPKLLNAIDPNQFGFIPGSSTQFALISMLHKWVLRLSDDFLKDMWKYADDTTISEVIPRFGSSALQSVVDKSVNWSDQNKLHLHPAKCKELRIQFGKRECMVEPIIINGQHLEIVKSAKILGMTFSDDLKWN